MSILPKEFYLDHDVLQLSQKLLGKFLLTQTPDGKKTGGIITETEAYKGPEDKASHAYNFRRTKRNDVMYHQGGIAYIYICYGIHHLFNVVTNDNGIPHAVLIRAISPKVGTTTMLKRRNKKNVDHTLTSGPGSLSQALGISRKDNGESLTGSRIWIEDRKIIPKKEEIIASPRVGINYAEEYVHVPWRFRLRII